MSSSSVPTKRPKMPKPDPNSFIQTEMRRIVMRLHTRSQSAEGKVEDKGKKFSEWKPTLTGYVQFLVDSRLIYSTLDEIVNSSDDLVKFRKTGLERVSALDFDLIWLAENYQNLSIPKPTSISVEYADYLREISQRSVPRFICHFYNHYFAHTAGGMRIGLKVSEACLDNHTLQFYKYGDENMKELLEVTRKNIDSMALSWDREAKDECLDEIPMTFKYGSAITSSIAG
eukprot:CAMPEP_0171460894 /NCGR_PEP_ID=MMETSP0945-20130129/5579_1 /TAXON_ID=109269 /ORGANISM="Vaucheria litorea, Strain CCMP2940" /LENGTH=228 /DNA_ID=CAMNT_0011987171 /DNA_START=314 /DNA_END=1000 /DNA_ORIENTATION=-